MPRSMTTHLKPGIGKRLRAARETAGLSQRQLAFNGCTSAYISRIEAGARNPSLQAINEIAKRVGVDPTWLATGRHADPLAVTERLRAAEQEIERLHTRLTQIAALALRDV